MKKILSIVFSLFFLSLFAQNEVKSVDFDLVRTDNVIKVKYELSGREKCSNITMQVIIDNKKFYPKAIKGDIGYNVKNDGEKKEISWNVLADYPNGIDNLLTINVIATNSRASHKDRLVVENYKPSMPHLSAMSWLKLGSSLTSSTLMILKGIELNKQSTDLYDVYKNNTCDEDQVYALASKTRNDYYSEANKKYKLAQTYTYTAYGLAAIGSTIFLKKLIKSYKIKAKYREVFSVSPTIELNPTGFSWDKNKVQWNSGVSLAMRF